MTDNIINIDFTKPDRRWMKKAQAARMNGQVEKAVQLFRTAAETNLSDPEAGLSYALYLWEIGCWYASNRECFLLLSCHPELEKVYGILYRNYLRMGQKDNARFCYEKYMMHLYKNPEDGLNLNEEHPPIPEKPTKRRFVHLVLRAAKLMERGKLDRANHLLVHANHPTFPKESVLRDIAELHLMAKTGLEEEACQIMAGMVQEERVDAVEALALLPILGEMLDGGYLDEESHAAHCGMVLQYALLRAENPIEVQSIVNSMLDLGHVSLCISLLERILEREPYRLDALYQLTICYLHANELQKAMKTIQLCYKLDPCDADVEYLYRGLTDGAKQGLSADMLRHMPITLYGESVSFARSLSQVQYGELYEKNSPEENADFLQTWTEHVRVMDRLPRWKSNLVKHLMDAINEMHVEKQEIFLRSFLFSGLMEEESEKLVLTKLSQLGVTGEVPVMQNGRLKSIPLEETH